MRYRLRTLMVLLALGPPALAWGLIEYGKYREQELEREAEAVFWTQPPNRRTLLEAHLCDEDFD